MVTVWFLRTTGFGFYIRLFTGLASVEQSVQAVVRFPILRESVIDMKYTIQLDLFIDNDNIMSEKEVQEVVEEIFNYTSMWASNIRVVEVND